MADALLSKLGRKLILEVCLNPWTLTGKLKARSNTEYCFLFPVFGRVVYACSVQRVAQPCFTRSSCLHSNRRRALLCRQMEVCTEAPWGSTRLANFIILPRRGDFMSTKKKLCPNRYSWCKKTNHLYIMKSSGPRTEP